MDSHEANRHTRFATFQIGVDSLHWPPSGMWIGQIFETVITSSSSHSSSKYLPGPENVVKTTCYSSPSQLQQKFPNAQNLLSCPNTTKFLSHIVNRSSVEAQSFVQYMPIVWKVSGVNSFSWNSIPLPWPSPLSDALSRFAQNTACCFLAACQQK